MKTYKEIVAEVKAKNPALAFKDVQIAASEIFKQAKVQADNAKNATGNAQVKPQENNPNLHIDTKHSIKPAKPDANYLDQLSDEIDSQIHSAGINRHSILRIAYSHDNSFRLVVDHKEGVNSMVYLDGPCRVPRAGFYRIFIG